MCKSNGPTYYPQVLGPMAILSIIHYDRGLQHNTTSDRSSKSMSVYGPLNEEVVGDEPYGSSLLYSISRTSE